MTIGTHVTKINNNAFSSCEFKNVYCYPKEVPLIGNNTFYVIAYIGNLYVPSNLLETYKSTDYWKEFQHIYPLKGDEPTNMIYQKGDVNEDGEVNIADAVSVVNPKSVIRNTKNRGQTCNVLKMSYLQNHFSNGGH